MLSKLIEYDDENNHIVVTLLDFPRHYEIKKGLVISLNNKNNNINKILSIFNLIKIVKEQKPDLIQTWMKANFYAIFLKIFTEAKIVSNFRNGYIGSHNKILIKMYNLYLKIFDGHIFVSKSSLEERNRIGMKFSEFKIINNGFSLPLFSNNSINETLTFGHMGRFHQVKNQKMLIEAFKIFSKNKNVKLVLAGVGLNKENLDLIGIIPEKLCLMGELKDTTNFYKKIDVFILTSLSEGFPNVIGEAMSYGIPVISTNAGESLSIIGDAGFKIKDMNELVKTMDNIYYHQNILQEKRIESRLRIEKNYTIEKTVESYQEYYKKIRR